MGEARAYVQEFIELWMAMMHPYATDSAERTKVPLGLALLSILLAWVIQNLLVAVDLTVPWWIVGPPSVMGFYGLLHVAFDRWAWRWRLWRVLGVVKVPDLKGEWAVTLISSFALSATPKNARVRIRQTWRSMLIRLDTDQSRSSSIISSMLTVDPNEFVLHYEYLNTPRVDATPTRHAHRGSVEVRFDRDFLSVGDGEYYSGRDRVNQGTLHFAREVSGDGAAEPG